MNNDETRRNRIESIPKSTSRGGGGFLLGLVFFLVLVNTAGIGFLVYTTVADKQATEENALSSQSSLNEGNNVTSQNTSETQSKDSSTADSSTLPSTIDSSQKSDTEGQNRTYTVLSGDTISDIAEKHKVTVAHLKTLNNLEDDNIQEGQVMKID